MVKQHPKRKRSEQVFNNTSHDENGHGLENGFTPNDKATVLTDTIQVLKDLTTEVNKLKAECAALIEESCEEKNELREEKSSLKSEVENLNVQYQQRMRVIAIPAPCSTFIPNSMPANPTFEQQSTQYASSSHLSNKKDSKSRSSDHQRGSIAEQDEDSNDVATDLELKMPGTSSHQEGDKYFTDGSSSSKLSSSQAFPDSSSNSVSDNPKSSR
ncbi:hypothetical protein ACJRO7_009766 [Eucalyptus globulus]|uniref:Uncharacterized protein n=1 Tax=Eucalyptus globulus TaxID=34317 RepID=A0ABD3LFF3_EUCGL